MTCLDCAIVLFIWLLWVCCQRCNTGAVRSTVKQPVTVTVNMLTGQIIRNMVWQGSEVLRRTMMRVMPMKCLLLTMAAVTQRAPTYGTASLQHFKDADENKLGYMQLFEAYCAVLEGSIQQVLQAAVPGLSMEEFAAMLVERQGQLGAEVFDMLMGMSDFTTFRELMLEARRQQDGSAGEELGGIACSAVPLHKEEQEDGEQRPDLDFCSLSIAQLGQAAVAAGQAGARSESKSALQACRSGSSLSRPAAPTAIERHPGAAVVVTAPVRHNAVSS
ncbi:hypothetical protein COO60DRAFT_1464200 [Scenedesmus sp. NREL 46B-D3]|nr:hypothetical protein COO60DRAFT_1464200 [Scenedesmus sp. NREL 46B-D3]